MDSEESPMKVDTEPCETQRNRLSLPSAERDLYRPNTAKVVKTP